MIVLKGKTKGPATSSYVISHNAKALYSHMASASISFHFDSYSEAAVFANKYGDLFALNPNKFSARFEKFFLPILFVLADAVVDKRKAKWIVNIRIGTAKGEIVAPVFSSVKRHLVSSFTDNQFTPRSAPQKNSVVSDDTLFEKSLLEHARQHVSLLKQRYIAFGYDPREVNTRYVSPDVMFETDTTEIPNIVYSDAENGIHCYPSSGKDVLRLSDAQYEALTLFLLWFFRTEQVLGTATAYDRIAAARRIDKPAKIEQADTLWKEIKKALDELASVYKMVFDGTQDLTKITDNDLKPMYINGKTTHYRQLLAEANKKINSFLIEHGYMSPIELVAQPRKTKPAGFRAASNEFNGEVRFRVHLHELKPHVQHLDAAMIDFVVRNHTTVSGAAILLQIDQKTAKKKPDVAAQIQKARQDAQAKISKMSLQQHIQYLRDAHDIVMTNKLLDKYPVV
ncbi:hypothetical protein [Paraburkholderia sp. HP33-1]|uniref:hypothetical protein n=1 Tax=Paraburkholderia sp. HP33-1 TaxID=2883243 RepID=UPI001F32C850|nr:hypothetical protein [Paraburkholderia sp. HP33-1]